MTTKVRDYYLNVDIIELASGLGDVTSINITY